MEYETAGGARVPAIGLGTWQMDEPIAYDAVSTALESGYRHVDTAQLYDNERAVGRAIADADVDRAELFVTTKIDPRRRSFAGMVESVSDSCDRLGLERVDLLLIHWPNPLAEFERVIAALDAARDRGLTRHIGVSNFRKKKLDRARALADAPIVTDQVLFNPWWRQRDLLRYCQDAGVLLTAYSPLANGGAIDDELLVEIGRRYDKTGPQTALRWTIQHENVVTIPMSTTPAHIAENIDIFDFRLTAAEHDRIGDRSILSTLRTMAAARLG